MAKNLNEHDVNERIEAQITPPLAMSRQEFRWFLRLMQLRQKHFAAQLSISVYTVCGHARLYPNAPDVPEKWAKIIENTLGNRQFLKARKQFRRQQKEAEKARKQAEAKKVQKLSA
jgi:hypothetical protein